MSMGAGGWGEFAAHPLTTPPAECGQTGTGVSHGQLRRGDSQPRLPLVSRSASNHQRQNRAWWSTKPAPAFRPNPGRWSPGLCIALP